MRTDISEIEIHLCATVFVFCMVLATNAQSYPVAGVKPDQRPAVAPKITEIKKGKQWYSRALKGVKPPYPASLRFLEDQGNWFTPFTHPGMPGRYDLRRWYR